MTLYIIMALIFLAGVLAIALEDVLKINKAAIAVGMCILLWVLTILEAAGLFMSDTATFFQSVLGKLPEAFQATASARIEEFVEKALTASLGDVATTLFFVLASMTIIEILDAHGSFTVITKAITATSKRKLLWIFSWLTFLFSAVLGNLATVIVMVAVVRKLVARREDILIYASMMIIAAGAGGSWSPIGDVTTLLLWTGKNLTATHQIGSLLLPAVVMMVVPLSLCTLMFKRGEVVEAPALPTAEASSLASVTPQFRKTLLVIGLSSLALVPVLQGAVGLPPFMGVLLGMVVLWVVTDIHSARHQGEGVSLKVSNLFSRLDLSTILFFLGILMSVKALGVVGLLDLMSTGLSSLFSEPNIIAFLLGICSSFLDNVALVAATMGMYPLQELGVFATDGSFWTFIAYCCVAGGSILIIGSAAGVTVMGLEKISFGYYFKRFTPLALLGYCAGAAVYLLLM